MGKPIISNQVLTEAKAVVKTEARIYTQDIAKNMFVLCTPLSFTVAKFTCNELREKKIDSWLELSCSALNEKLREIEWERES